MLIIGITVLYFIFASYNAASSVWDYLTIGQGDNRYCMLYGDCVLDNLTVTNYVNFTVTEYEVNGSMTLTGDVVARSFNGSWNGSGDYYTQTETDTLIDSVNKSYWENSTGTIKSKNNQNVTVETDGDTELEIKSKINGYSYLQLTEGSDLGYYIGYDGSGTNYLYFDAMLGEELGTATRFKLRRNEPEANLYAELKMENNNITDVACIEFSDGSLQCSNATGGYTEAEVDALLNGYMLNTGDTATGNYTFDTNTLHIDSTNNRVGIGTTSPTEKLDVNSDAIRIRTNQTPATAGAIGAKGMIAWDDDYIYVCTATNTWKRAALSTW